MINWIFSLALAAELNNFRVNVGSYLILDETWYKLAFTFSQPVSDASVFIIFPPDVEFKAFECKVLSPDVSFFCNSQGSNVTLEVTELVKEDFLVTVQINGVVNPAPGKKYELEVRASSLSLGFSDSSKEIIEYTALALDSVSLTSSSKTCGSNSDWTLSFFLSKQLPENASLQIFFPFWNKNLDPGDLVERFWDDSTRCSPICEKTGNFFFTQMEKGTVGSYSMNIYSIKNPPSTEVVNGFHFKVFYEDGTFLDSFNSTVSIACFEANSLKEPKLELSESKVNSPSQYQLSFITTSPLPRNAFIMVQLPASVTVTGSSVTPIEGIEKVSFTSVQSGKTLTLSSILSSYKPGGQKIRFILNNCTNPGSSLRFSIQVSTSYQSFRSDSSSLFESSATPGSLKVHQISSDVPSVNQISRMQFKLSSFEPIMKGFALVIHFPEGLSLQSSSFTASALTSTKGESQVRTNSIFIQNLFDSNIGTEPFVFFITNVKNPNTTKARCCFSIQLFTEGDFLNQVANNTVTGFQALPGLCEVRVTPESFVTGQVSSYLFELKIENPLSSKGLLLIEVPQEIKNKAEKVSVIQGIDTGFQFALIGSSQVKLTQVFVQQFSGLLKFSIKNFTNPESFKESSSFQVRTFEDSDLVDQVTNGVTVKMNETHELNDLKVSSSSNIVASQTTLTFEISPFNALPSVIHISPPSTVVFSKSVACASDDSELSFCTVINGVLKTEILSQKSSRITLKVSNLKNPPSTEPVSFKVTTSKDQYNMDSSTAVFQASTPAALKSLTATMTPSYISEPSTQILTYSLSTQFPQSGWFEVRLSFITSAVKCFLGSQEITCSASAGQVSLFGAFSGSGEITLKNLINPTEAAIFPVTLTSKTSSSYSVEQQEVLISITCKSPCKTCTGTANNCSSCDSLVPYLYEQSCHSACKPGFYASSLKTCERCLSPCEQCEGSSSRCTECAQGYLLGSECLEKCSAGTYASGKACLSCVLPCKKCETKEKCLECAAPYILSSSSCIISCPYPQISVSGSCVSCVDCLTCASSPNTCTSCSPTSFLFKSSCLSACPPGTIGQNSICKPCSSNCLTCSGDSSSCSSCPKGWVLESSTCTSECSAGLYSLEGSCLPCKYPCSTCESSTSCLTCSSGLLLQGRSCVNRCDSGFFASGQLCEPCPASCSRCLSSNLCTDCLAGRYLFHSTCLSQCPSGFFASQGVCLDCVNCAVCSEELGCMSGCSEGKVYLNGTCLDACPSRTVEVESVCISCQGCLDCEGSPTNCSACEEDLILFEGMCLKNCPQGYHLKNSSCQFNETGFCAPECPFALFNNSVCDSQCNNELCLFDNSMCLKDYEEEPVRRSDEFEVRQDPFIISALSVSVAIVSAGVSLTAGGQFLMISCPLVACFEAVTKISLLASIGQADGFKGRALVSNDQKFNLILGAMVGVFTLHFLVNLCFVLVYWCYLRKTDHLHKTWTQLNRWGIVLMTFLMTCFSFKVALLMVSKVPKVSLFDGKFESNKAFRRVFRFFALLSFFIVFVPFLSLCALILASFSHGSVTFNICLDCAVLEIFSLCITFAAICYDPEPSVKYLQSKKTIEESTNTVIVTETVPDFTKRNQSREEQEAEESDKASTPPSSEGTVVNYPEIISAIRIKKPVLNKKPFSFSLANMAPSYIESEEIIDFDDFQIDLDDLRRVYLKIHGFQSKLPVLKDFYPPVIIDADGQIIEADLNLTDYELISIDTENPKIGEFRHKVFNTRVRLLRDFTGSAIESLQIPDAENDPTLKLETPLSISRQDWQSLDYSPQENNSSLKSTSKVSITTLLRSGSPPKGISSRSLYPHPGLNYQQDSP